MNAAAIDQKPNQELTKPIEIGTEISITGKWVPRAAGGLFRSSPDAEALRLEWADIHADARVDDGLLATEINLAVGEEAVLVHHVFKDADALRSYFGSTASTHAEALLSVARPELHLVRGRSVPGDIAPLLQARQVPVVVGQHGFGFVRDYAAPDLTTAVQVTAKWTCKPGAGQLAELEYWWQKVAETALEIEPGLLRFEAYRVDGEEALIIHETFRDTDELKFHLTKGTANQFKKHLDKIAAPENYFFRGPVAWMIRAYSKVLRLPATYSTRGLHHAQPGGSASDGWTS